MPRLALLASSLLCFSLLAPAAQALPCGATVTRDLRLQADLVCSGAGPALIVAGKGTLIDLNGHRLRGDGRGTGILVEDAADVRIAGGRIEGFATGIEALRAPRLNVEAVQFAALDSGLLLHNSPAATVRDNGFERILAHAISAKALAFAPFAEDGGHRIEDNRIATAGFGLHLCGYDSGGALLRGNTLSDISQVALLIEDGADANRIEDNLIERSGVVGIALRGSSGNRIQGNQLLGGRVGVSLVPEAGPGCLARGPAAVADNRIEHNLIADHARSFALGQTRPRAPIGPNRLRHNLVLGSADADATAAESDLAYARPVTNVRVRDYRD